MAAIVAVVLLSGGHQGTSTAGHRTQPTPELVKRALSSTNAADYVLIRAGRSGRRTIEFDRRSGSAAVFRHGKLTLLTTPTEIYGRSASQACFARESPPQPASNWVARLLLPAGPPDTTYRIHGNVIHWTERVPPPSGQAVPVASVDGSLTLDTSGRIREASVRVARRTVSSFAVSYPVVLRLPPAPTSLCGPRTVQALPWVPQG